MQETRSSRPGIPSPRLAPAARLHSASRAQVAGAGRFRDSAIERGAMQKRSAPERPLDALQAFDRKLHAAFGGVTVGLAPSALIGAYLDWATHLLIAPGKQAALAAQATRRRRRPCRLRGACITGKADDPCRCALPHDNRFRSPEWQTFPFNVYAHGFLAMEQWWEAATTGVRGVERAARSDGDLRRPADARHRGAVELHRDESAGAGAHARNRGRQPHPRRGELRRRSAAADDRPAAGRHRRLQGRRDRRGDARQGRASHAGSPRSSSTRRRPARCGRSRW